MRHRVVRGHDPYLGLDAILDWSRPSWPPFCDVIGSISTPILLSETSRKILVKYNLQHQCDRKRLHKVFKQLVHIVIDASN